MGKPKKNKTGKAKNAKPTAKNTKTPSTKKPKEKKTRETFALARLPYPSADGIPNPLLIDKRNKRALCIAFAHCTGGSVQDDGPQDQLLMKAIRECGVCQKSGLTLANCTDENSNVHIAQSEQSGRGYAIRTGRAKHDDYMKQYPDKVEICMPFAQAFIAIMQKSEANADKARERELSKLPALRDKIAKAQEEAQSKRKSKASKKPAKTPAKTPAKKPAKVLKGKKGKPSKKKTA